MEPINVCLTKINSQNLECSTYRSNEFEKDLIVHGRFDYGDRIVNYYKVLKTSSNSIWLKPMLKYNAENPKMLNIITDKTHLRTNGVVIKKEDGEFKIKLIKHIVVKNYYLNQSSDDFLNAYDIITNKIIKVVNIAKHFPRVLPDDGSIEYKNLFATALTPDLILLHKLNKNGELGIDKLYTPLKMNLLIIGNAILGKFDKTHKVFVADTMDANCYLVNKKLSHKAFKMFIRKQNILYDKYGYCVCEYTKQQ